jgi:Cu(I)/Ag(I) efflux system periplasmic protein CusF
MKSALLAATVIGAGLALAVMAQTASPQGADKSSKATTQASAAAPSTEGEVRKVDKDAGKITLKHGPIGNLEMPAMTMVFRVKDPSMLDKVKAGEKVRFAAEKVGGALTITDIQPAP